MDNKKFSKEFVYWLCCCLGLFDVLVFAVLGFFGLSIFFGVLTLVMAWKYVDAKRLRV